MFFRDSRYRRLPDDVTVDARGRRLLSKSLRPLPEVNGRFLHTLEQSDRLDHLAYKYYNQPCKWWRICDANPEFLWPQALLGKDPFVTLRFPITYIGRESQPALALLLRQISSLVGVEDAGLDDDEQAIIIIYNRLNLQTEDLAREIQQAGFRVAHPQTIGRAGKTIVIPPDIAG